MLKFIGAYTHNQLHALVGTVKLLETLEVDSPCSPPVPARGVSLALNVPAPQERAWRRDCRGVRGT